MGIQVLNAEILPAITYDRLHLVRLDIEQSPFTDDTAMPVYQVRVAYQLFGVVNSVRHYHSSGTKEILLPDFLSLALADAGQGDMTLLGAIQGIEAAVAAIMTDQVGMLAQVI